MKRHTLTYVILILAFNCFGQKTDDSIKARKYKVMAIDKIKLKDYQIAKAYLDTAIMLDKKYDLAYYNRGTLAIFTENYKSALKDFNIAIKLNPNDIEYYYNRGRANYKLQKYSSAFKDFDKVISVQPNIAIVYSFRGSASDQLKKWENALADFSKAIELDSLNSEKYADRAMVKLKLKDNIGAELDCEKGFILDTSRVNTGLLLYLRGLARMAITGKETIGKQDIIDAAKLGYQEAIDVLDKLMVTKIIIPKDQ
ncbi:MAG: tetratricopeptide repeat protein [Bacteroidota bacterium]